VKIRELSPPRAFRCGRHGDVEIAHAADVELAPGEMVTFVSGSGAEHDVVRTPFGYYATQSLNGRLPAHGLRPVMTENAEGRRYVLLVERGREAEFARYLAREENRVVAWLDRAGCPLCASGDRAVRFRYGAPPEGETRFDSIPPDAYAREMVECSSCGHFESVHQLDLSALYDDEYARATYGVDGLRAAFERIQALPEGRSDNRGRVQRILDFAAPRVAASGRAPSVLDVGAGLCVFLARMKDAGWDCTALDPDAAACAHARDHVGVRAVHGRFDTVAGLGRFDLVTFNKVLEHVADPVAMLARARELLHPGGLVYVELPDGEAAADAGPGREEFFVEHLAVYSAASLALLARRAGFRVERLERLREPSTKYTLYAFLA
jgi:2-polyprenyl-3-methyl-5-hydroxy-6-metoxy-1,4-benzoquinol methylase